MVTSVHGASGDVWMEDGKGNSTVGQIKPVAYQVLDGNDKCIGGLYKHENAPRGFSQSFGSIHPFVVEDVVRLTKIKDEDYFVYLRRIKKSKTATAVKIADLKDNMDTSRYGHLKLNPAEAAKIRNRCDKYAEALKFLTSG